MTSASSDAEAAVQIAETYFAAGNYRRAEEVVATVLATNPHHPRLLTAYARARLGQSDHATAASSAHAALAVEPENEHSMRVYSRALEGLGRLPEALLIAWRAATTHPDSQLAHYGYARLLEITGRPNEAMTVVNEALRLNPSDVDTLILRGDVYVALGQAGPAQADYREALRLNPENVAAVHSLAAIRYARGRRWSAIRGFLGAGGLDPSYGGAARRNVSLVLTVVLRRSAWLVLIVGIGVIVTYTGHERGDPTVIPRIIAGLGAALLLVTFARVMHELPRQTLKSVLRQRQILAIRILQLFAGVVFGAQTAIFGAMTVPAVLASLLVLSLPVVFVVGALTSERLW